MSEKLDHNAALVKAVIEGLDRANGKAVIPVPPFLLKASFDVLVPIGAGYFVKGQPKQLLKYVERTPQ